MSKLEAMMEAERRGILPPDKSAALQEARRRGLIGGDAQASSAPQANAEPDLSKVRDYSLNETLWNYLDQGFSAGFGDDISDLYMAGARAIRGDNFSDAFKQQQERSQLELAKQRQQYPVASKAAELTGTIATGVGASSTKAGGQVARWLLDGGKGARMAKTAVVAAPSGFAYGFGTSTGDLGERLKAGGESAVNSAVVAPATLGAAYLAQGTGKYVGKGAKNLWKGFKARDADALQNVADSIKKRSQDAYGYMRRSGATFKKSTANKIVDDIESALNQDGALDAQLHGAHIRILKRMRDDANKGGLTLENFENYRRLMQDAGSDVMKPYKGHKSGVMIDALGDAVDQITDADLTKGSADAIEALNYGRQEWARLSKFRAISDIIKKSDGDANKLKRALTSFLNNPKKTRGFNDDELEALQYAARQSVGEGMYKMLGKFGFDLGASSTFGNTALPGLGMAGGFVANPVAGVAVPAVGTAARQAQKYAARGKADDLLRVIEGIAPQQAQQGQIPASIARLLGYTNATTNPIAQQLQQTSPLRR